MQWIGLNPEAVFVIVNILQSTTHHINTVFGILVETYFPTVPLLQGIGYQSFGL